MQYTNIFLDRKSIVKVGFGTGSKKVLLQGAAISENGKNSARNIKYYKDSYYPKENQWL